MSFARCDPAATEADDMDSFNYVGWINEQCRSVRFVTEADVGPPHAPRWSCTLTVEHGGKVIEKEVKAVLGSKVQARKAAARGGLVAEEIAGSMSSEPAFNAGPPSLRQHLPLTGREQLELRELNTELVRVLVDADNVSWVSAAFCAQFPFARFVQFCAKHSNLKHAKLATRQCANVWSVQAATDGADIVDVLMLTEAERLAQTRGPERTACAANLQQVVLVSKDKLLRTLSRIRPDFVVTCDTKEELKRILDGHGAALT
ncbi:unnamed protein product [Pedinophyceae sp. YPF-701]|nr:unnamed protein product [Pedinophyceae sp. YPF-701]